jgi:hypothetical protein
LFLALILLLLLTLILLCSWPWSCFVLGPDPALLYCSQPCRSLHAPFTSASFLLVLSLILSLLLILLACTCTFYCCWPQSCYNNPLLTCGFDSVVTSYLCTHPALYLALTFALDHVDPVQISFTVPLLHCPAVCS